MNLYSLFNGLSVSHNAFWKVPPNPKGAAGYDDDSVIFIKLILKGAVAHQQPKYPWVGCIW